MAVVAGKDSALNLLLNESKQLKVKFENDSLLLRNEFEARLKVCEVKEKGLRDKLDEAEEEVRRLREKLQNLECELVNANSLQDKLKEKDMKINSLELAVKEYKNLNEGLKEKNKSLGAELAREKNDSIEAKTRYYDLQNSINSYEERIRSLTNSLNEANNELQKKEDEVTDLENEYKTQREELNAQLREASKKLADSEAKAAKLQERASDLKTETETWKSKYKSKEDKLQELTSTLMQQNKLSWELEAQLHQAQEEVDQVRAENDRLVEENEELKNELAERDDEIEHLTYLLSNRGGDDNGKSSQIIFTSDKSDNVDEMFALYINAVRCPVKLKKIGDGQYIFGTKKIFAKIQNGKLVIRVGGGYMMIEDFLTTYTAQELSKMGRNAVNEFDSEPATNSNHKPVRPVGKETVVEGEPESDNAHTVAEGSRSKYDRNMLTKNSTKSIGRLSNSISARSKSPGFANRSSRTRVLFDQDLANSKMVRSSVDRLEHKIETKKFNVGEERIDKENDTDNDK
eukprot:TRINITY_DN8409_c0_g3_i4.p1 TRINITY_DN8409_c0_g3~~TRINITY_DN8409_c0_g3_i4.p1  ORF type:complete len:582 (-),score=187.76 TRINITY_DN8409_c0_g3_i4:130-1680(-)